jgi:hypothetical protein
MNSKKLSLNNGFSCNLSLPKKGKTRLEKYEEICFDIAKDFWEKYYKCDEEETWAQQLTYEGPGGNDPSGVWCFGDMCWGFSDMVTALKLEATWEQISEWYEETLAEIYEPKGNNKSLEQFLKYGWIGKIYTEEEIKDSEESMERAKKLFYDAIGKS